MDIKSQHTVLEIQLFKKQAILDAIARLKLIAALIVLLTIFIGYASPASSTHVFISLLPFLVVQIFAVKEYVELAKISRRIRLMSGGYFPCNHVRILWTIAAGVAIRDSYFILLLFFDVSWLSHAYLYPSPANSFNQFLQQLSIGPVSGVFFIWFTIFLWILYAYLFIVGIVHSNEINLPEEVNSINSGNNSTIALQETWIKVKTFDNDELYLQGHRIHNDGKQPLILFPGFFQNGYVYHLTEEISLARFLWENDFDIWIIHPRGTAQSDGRRKKSSLDDFASDDIPAVISYVYAKTGIKPVFVGHSQGGISAIISMMGACKLKDATVILSDEEKEKRQGNLKALVTIGSFLDFTFTKKSRLKTFVTEGLVIKLWGRRIRLLRSQSLITVIRKINFLGTPVSFKLRTALLENKALRWFLFPVTIVFNFISTLKIWEFLYHIPNLSNPIRKTLFYKTMDGTFSPIIQQFYSALAHDEMRSANEVVNYSVNYHRLTLPVSIVTMEFDSLADPAMTEQNMFNTISADNKFFTCWQRLGHEDHFANTTYFSQVLAAIRKVC